MKNNDLIIYGSIAAILYLINKNSKNTISGVNDSQLWNNDRIKKKLGRVMIDYRELRDASIKTVNKTDMAYTSGMNYVINQIFTDKEQFIALGTQF